MHWPFINKQAKSEHPNVVLYWLLSFVAFPHVIYFQIIHLGLNLEYKGYISFIHSKPKIIIFMLLHSQPKMKHDLEQSPPPLKGYCTLHMYTKMQSCNMHCMLAVCATYARPQSLQSDGAGQESSSRLTCLFDDDTFLLAFFTTAWLSSSDDILVLSV